LLIWRDELFGILLVVRTTELRVPAVNDLEVRHTSIRGSMKRAGTVIMLTFSVVLLAGCGDVPRNVTMDDSQVQQLVKAAQSFDRTSYGFSPIPRQRDVRDVRLELRPTGGYDAMLHITAQTGRTIAFSKENGNYVWIGDQETFEGPKKYKTVDGISNEAITLTYETQRMSGYPLNQLNVTYRGEDPRLDGRNNLTLAIVKPILKEWGY
jgi:hypothetical protein